MKTYKELSKNDVENWAKEVEKFPKRKLTDEEVEGLLKFSMYEDRMNEDKEIIRLLDERKGGMASVIWLRIKHCHTYSITPALAVYLGDIISNSGISTMMCNYLQYMAYKHKQKVIDFKTFGMKIFPMGFISDTDWQKAWDMQKIINDNKGSDNMLDNSFCMQSIREL